MPVLLPGPLFKETVWREARSALPDAPVVEEAPGLRHRTRARLGALLRALARQQIRLAERVDPSCPGHPGARPARAG